MIIEPDEFPYRFPALKFHVDFKTAQAPIDSAEEAAKEVQSEGLTRLFFWRYGDEPRPINGG